MHGQHDNLLSGTHLIPSLKVVHAPAVGDQVDALCGIFGVHDLSEAAGIDEAGHFLAGSFIGSCRLTTQGVHTPVHIGVGLLIVVLHGLQDLQRLLGSGCVVKVDERVPIDLLVEDREVPPQGLAHP